MIGILSTILNGVLAMFKIAGFLIGFIAVIFAMAWPVSGIALIHEWELLYSKTAWAVYGIGILIWFYYIGKEYG